MVTARDAHHRRLWELARQQQPAPTPTEPKPEPSPEPPKVPEQPKTVQASGAELRALAARLTDEQRQQFAEHLDALLTARR